MHKTKLLVAVLSTLIALPAMAEESSPLSANVSLTSNYLFRGMSQTGTQPALQGGFDFAHASGFYAGVWASNISWLSDANTATNASLEVDTYLGFGNSFAGDFSYDVGYLRYNYPGTYAVGAIKADTDELYGAIGYKMFTAKYSYSLGDTFGVANAQGTSYLEINADVPLGDSGLNFGAHLGRQSFKGTTADALTAAGTTPTYSDYKLGISKEFNGFGFDLSYSKTNAQTGGFWTDPQGHDLGKGTAVLTISRSL